MIRLPFRIPDKKYWENVRVRIARLDGLRISTHVQLYRYANMSPVRSCTEPIPIDIDSLNFSDGENSMKKKV